MSLLTDLSALLGAAFSEIGLDPSLGEVVVSQRQELGQLQCNGALPAARQAGRPPRDIAADVVALVETDPRIGHVDVAGPGFINITLSDEYLAERLDLLAADDRFGVEHTEHPRKIIVDYGGPNVAKSLHVGHIRVALIGEALKRILRFVGHDALGDVHLGDWGLPMGQLIAELEERRPDLPYFDPDFAGPYPDESPVTMSDLEEMYPTAAAKAKEDVDFAERSRRATADLQNGRPGYRALWEHFRSVSVDELRSVYHSLGVEFDLWLGEASVHDRIAPMIDHLKRNGAATESEGALVVEVSRPDDTHEIPPLMLANSRGAYTYGTTDLATVEERVQDLDADEIVYVVDLRQSLHFEQVFRAARRGGIAADDVILIHAGNGTVNGPDGKPFKTREGGIPRLASTIAEAVERADERIEASNLAAGYPEEERREIARKVGLAALKYGELSNHRASDYSFDLDRFTQLQGRTGPYIQYVSTRCSSILRKAAEAGFAPGPAVPPTVDAERQLILALSTFPEAVERTIEGWAPNHLCEYAFELAGFFNRFYDACHILSEDDPAQRGSWLTLVETTRTLLAQALGLLTIEVPDRM